MSDPHPTPAEAAMANGTAMLSENEHVVLEAMADMDDAGFKKAMESASTRFEVLRCIRKAVYGRRA